MHENCHKDCVPRAEFEKLYAEVVELRKLVQILMSPHIPSSKQIIKEKEEPKEPKKLGAPEGHKGATRKTPMPNRIINHEKPSCCIKCNSQNLKIKQRKKIIEDIIIIPDIAEINYFDCSCKDCGKMFETTSLELPPHGKFGPNITALWANMHYIGTIPFKRLSTISTECFSTNITPSGIMNAVYRTSKTFEPEFEVIKENVKKSDYAGSDETKYSDSWLWNISTRTDVLVLMRNTRSSRVLIEVFGERYSGILNSDCFSAYEKYEADEYQKCWAHILQDAEDLAKHNHEGKELYKDLSRMYKYIKRTKENKEEDSEKAKFWTWRQKQKMKSWINESYESKAVLNLVLRINKYLDQWFTCLKYDFVEPTNNTREREIRKNVISRKISGCHRSDKGKRAREIMMSNILTIKKKGETPFEFIQNTIKNHNLGIVNQGF